MIKLIPPWVLPSVIAALVLTNGITYNRLQAAQTDHAKTRAAHAEQLATAQETRAKEEAKRRATEQELQNANETHATEVAALRTNLDTDRAAAGVAAVRLRDTARATAQRASAQCAAASTAELRQTASAGLDVLADVLSRIDDRAGELAAIADDRHLAGRACERAYDSAREALSR
jgi:uncharacterized membrane protein YqiK